MFFTADNHFNHTNMIMHENRPFNCVEEMNEIMIDKWNKKVGRKDSIYIVGDFIWSNPDKIIPRLNGKKHLIKGNHDKQIKQHYFEWVKDYYELKYNNTIVVLSHYPIFRWNRSHYGSYHFYGHVHSNKSSNDFMSGLGNAYNVGVDVNNYEPVAIEEIIKKLDKVLK